jgi:oligopeptide transport system ATP-binding protein
LTTQPRGDPEADRPIILEVRNLVTRFYTPEGVVHAVNGISFELRRDETLGIVGESGCGKTVTMLSILRLLPQPPGRIIRGSAVFQGSDLLQASNDHLRSVRGGRIGMIFQDPMSSLNPVMPVWKQIAEPIVEHLGLTPTQARTRVIELLNLVGIPQARDRLHDYPHQFSGGMRQRVMIAMAVSCNPKVLIADEPTTALDVTIQAQIIELVTRMRDQFGLAVIWITHDLGIIAGLAERVIVMYAGHVVECANVRELFANPRHPYTVGLLGALPRLDREHSGRLANIEGRPPVLLDDPAQCPFAPRCSHSVQQCWEEKPRLRTIRPAHEIACWVDIADRARVMHLDQSA